VLREIMTTVNNPATQLAAASALLDRGFGKPFQAVAIRELPPIDVNINASVHADGPTQRLKEAISRE
jgi:hypothetical protein